MEKTFKVITGKYVNQYLDENRAVIKNDVKDAYIAHYKGLTENPHSHFLRFRSHPENRIIALPAHFSGDQAISGIKWIASYPHNIKSGLQRASATMILNDAENGYPIACLEASRISAARTAASALLAAETYKRKDDVRNLTVVGCGVISKEILSYFKDDGWEFDNIIFVDKHFGSSKYLSEFSKSIFKCSVLQSENIEQAIVNAQIVIFATNASEPHFNLFNGLQKGCLILNISLRDISVELIEKSINVVDDISHCLRENTSVHNAYKKNESISFKFRPLPEDLVNGHNISESDIVVFSPFGLGILDLAVARRIYLHSNSEGTGTIIHDFFPDISRYGM